MSIHSAMWQKSEFSRIQIFVLGIILPSRSSFGLNLVSKVMGRPLRFLCSVPGLDLNP